MTLSSDLKVLYHLALSPIRGGTHKERLESFYKGQADDYDAFRKRLLQGREEMCRSHAFPVNGVWVDVGGGTGANLEFVADRLAKLRKAYVVDLSPSLLALAKKRAEQHGWTNVETVEADATTYLPADGPADLVTFSYSLTMIPDWFAAIDQAHRMLAPGGRIGVVDFYVSRKYPADGRQKHGKWTRTFWPAWFGSDNVNPSPDHLPYLERRFKTVSLLERRAWVPYVPMGKVPYYIYVGEKTAEPDRAPPT